MSRALFGLGAIDMERNWLCSGGLQAVG